MKGFDPRWRDFPDYILGITREIWEDRGIATLHQYYTPDLVVRSPSSVVIGNENVIAATMATLAEFPDRQLLGEDVIWSGSPEEGMLSSHRILSTATHLADGMYGKATGKKFTYRIIADCHAINNAINDEWLIRDQGAIVAQMGMTPEAFARDLIEREGGPDKCVQPFTPAIDKPGPYQGRGNDDEVGARYADILSRIMGADMAAIPTGMTARRILNIPAVSPRMVMPRRIVCGWACALRCPLPLLRFIIRLAVKIPLCRPARRFAGRCMESMTVGVCLADRQGRRFMSWASVTRNLALAVCGANTRSLTKPPFGNRSSCKRDKNCVAAAA